jgi:chloramphenicol O-acetyltransferase
MTKTVEEVRRELFEAGINIRTRTRNEHGDYVLGEIRDMWAGFSAALDAVEIQLPSERKIRHMPTPDENQSYNEALENCRDAIEQTGLGLKIK